MNDKNFRIALIIILTICVAITIGMVIYTTYLHYNCSILAFIGNER